MKKPTYQDLYHYILKNGQAEKTADEYVASIAEDLNLTATDLAERYPSGEGVIRNRVRWAIHYLLRARLLEKPSRGYFVISKSGKTFSLSHRGPFSNSDLNEIPEFQEFKNKTKREEEKVRLLAHTRFSGKMGNGNVVYANGNVRAEGEPIEPESVNAAMWKIACGTK